MYTVKIIKEVSNAAYLYWDVEYCNKTIESEEFNTKREANKYKKEIISKYDLKGLSYHYANFKTGLELETNY